MNSVAQRTHSQPPATSGRTQLWRGLLAGCLLVVAGCAGAVTADRSATLDERVTVGQGQLRGEVQDDVVVFKGIPYAQPPVGERRFRAPLPAATWTGERDATLYGPACPQPRRRAEQKLDEDCLYANVWAPRERDGALPVMVWIHGGGFRAGSGSSPAYAGHHFVREGVVLVTINYRLGALGFIAHDAISAAYPDEPHGPYGLMDMVLALEWVRDNVAAFGGDPNNVTIFGESAGGMAVQLLMAAPSARGLFHRAISQSGYGTWPLPRMGVATTDHPRAEEIGAAIFEVAGAPAGATIEDLRALEPSALADAVAGLHLPVVDGDVLPDEPGVVFAAGEQSDVPFVVGGNSYDGTVVLLGGGFDAAGFLAGFGDDEAALRGLYADDFDESELRGGSRLFGDRRYLLAARVLAGAMSSVSSDGHLYYYSFVPTERAAEWAGAPHASELGPLFGNAELSEESAAVGSLLRRTWVEFARSGRPAAEGAVTWPAYDSEEDLWMNFGATASIEGGLLKAKLDLLTERWHRRVKQLPGATGETP